MIAMSERSIYTDAVHAGDMSSEHFGALSTPIYPASVYAFDDADSGADIHNEIVPGYYYGRLGNPTQTALEQACAALEQGDAAFALASGMAAVSAAVLTVASAGDHIVAPRSGYSTTANFFKHIEKKFGIETTFIDASKASDYEEAIRPNTKLFWIETPSNPMLTITDLRAVADIAGPRGIMTVADNTFASPFNQLPLAFGIDAVIHSATKYFGGHSDLTAGVIIGDRKIVEAARSGAGKYYGGNIAPQVAWLVMRGLKTLALRMERHNANAMAIAEMLSGHPRAAAVYYPGLESHLGHHIAARQMARGFGGMIALDLGTLEAGKAFVNNVRLCKLATSLGGVETIVQHSASMTHATFTADERRAAGIGEGLIRLSVGIEDVNDIIDDLTRALDGISL